MYSSKYTSFYVLVLRLSKHLNAFEETVLRYGTFSLQMAMLSQEEPR